MTQSRLLWSEPEVSPGVATHTQHICRDLEVQSSIASPSGSVLTLVSLLPKGMGSRVQSVKFTLQTLLPQPTKQVERNLELLYIHELLLPAILM